MVERVAEQYELWPYPRISFFAKVPKEQLWQINSAWLSKQCGQPIEKKPKIWIAGCGTFQPYAFSLANPGGEVFASDLSEASLSQARKRCHLHGVRNVQFKKVDLSDEKQYPDEKFDLIECYGVLMCLPDPAAALKNLAKRLKPSGVLRIMVYTHYGRQRIFQIQRLAKLLGFNHHTKSHPLQLKKIMKALPEEHPLSYAFQSYEDSKNSEGIVDGFLHASDRGFTGIEISEDIQEAGLKIGYCMHRPWGQPREMAEKLGIRYQNPALWLHYLDLWQSLRTNFVLCLVPENSVLETDSKKFRHPLFDFENDSLNLRDKMRLLKLSATGTRLQSRTHESSINLKAKDVRRLVRGDWEEILKEPRSFFEGSPLGALGNITPNSHFVPRTGKKVPNPLYAYLFDAFVFSRQWKENVVPPLPSLTEEMKRWETLARPLEDSKHRFGLTPCGTYRYAPKDVEEVSERFLELKTTEFEKVALADKKSKFRQVTEFLKKTGLKTGEISPEVLKELWFLLFSYSELFMDIEVE